MRGLVWFAQGQHTPDISAILSARRSGGLRSIAGRTFRGCGGVHFPPVFYSSVRMVFCCAGGDVARYFSGSLVKFRYVAVLEVFQEIAAW